MLKYSGESARVTHETAQAPPLDHRYANCARALYTECPILTEKNISRTDSLMSARSRFFLNDNTP